MSYLKSDKAKKGFSDFQKSFKSDGREKKREEIKGGESAFTSPKERAEKKKKEKSWWSKIKSLF